MNPKAILMGFVIFLVGYGFFSGFFPNATYSYWLAEAVANGTLFIILGIAIMAVGIFAGK